MKSQGVKAWSLFMAAMAVAVIVVWCPRTLARRNSARSNAR